MADISCDGKRFGGDAKRQSCQRDLDLEQSRSFRLRCAPIILFTTSTMNGQASARLLYKNSEPEADGALPALRLRRLDVKGMSRRIT